MSTIRVLIVDGDPVTRRGLHATLDPVNDLVVVGEADSGETATARPRELTPDVVFMDARVPGIGGIEATKAIKQASAETRVILLTDDESRASVSEAIRAGISGYLPKDADAVELVNAVRRALEGEAVFPPALTAAFTEAARIAGQPMGSPPLSKREQEILKWLALGAPGERIAKELGISRNTVIHNIQRIFEKLGVRSRLEAIAAEIRTSRREAIREPEPKTRTEWIHRLPEPHLRRILMERREDVLRQTGKGSVSCWSRQRSEVPEPRLRRAGRERSSSVQDLTQGMSDEELARLVEHMGTPSDS